MSQLPFDCLNEIFEYLENKNLTLRSCLLVNHLWCEIAVRILWRNVWNYCSSNFRTLIACLPNESKEILCMNGIIISAPTLKPLMFNYASFCKVLSVSQVNFMIKNLLVSQQPSIPSEYINSRVNIVELELQKLFINQISSLKKLAYISYPYTTFTIYPEAKDSLKNLSELRCSSNINSEFFYQLSQMCHKIQTLSIGFSKVISNGLADLISVQKNLKCFSLK